MPICVGTPGCSYPEWKGTFYPDTLAAAKMLPYYAERFPTVEINYTFYRTPNEKILDGWNKATPDRFHWTTKLAIARTGVVPRLIPSSTLPASTDTDSPALSLGLEEPLGDDDRVARLDHVQEADTQLVLPVADHPHHLNPRGRRARGQAARHRQRLQQHRLFG